MITWNASAQALIDAAAAGTARVELVLLLYLGFTVPQRYAIAGHAKTWSSQTWAPLDLAIAPIEDSTDNRAGLRFSFPGVTTSELAVALTGDVEGSAVEIYLAVCNPADGTVADAKLRWVGKLDIPGWQDGAADGSSVVNFTAEHLADIALTPKPWRYTNDAQQRLSSGDTFLDTDPFTDGAPVVWPASSYFKVPEV